MISLKKNNCNQYSGKISINRYVGGGVFCELTEKKKTYYIKIMV